MTYTRRHFDIVLPKSIIIDSRSFRVSPYKTSTVLEIAKYSIKHKCYGQRLDDLCLLSNCNSSTCTSRHAATNSRVLAKMELDGLHTGLHFRKQVIEVPVFPSASNRLRAVLPEIELTVRKDLSAVIVEMITRPGVWENLHWQHEKLFESGQRMFTGFYSTAAWEEAQKQFGLAANIAGLLIFSDSTEILRFSRRTLHPIYICPAGLDFDHMGLGCMSLVGFIPSLPQEMKAAITDSDKKDLARWHRCMLANIYTFIIKTVNRISLNGGYTFSMLQGSCVKYFPWC
jgi:hypothetical protein